MSPRTVFTRVGPTEEAGDTSHAKSGSIEVLTKKRFRVICGRGAVEVEKLQRHGKSKMAAGAYMQGRRLRDGDYFGPLEDS